ncbi:MAG: glutamyl-tRNA reductase [Crenarchaeota archaeon]|nr:glutamyl-tRNA reductase [Thermoproteota archaeon]
MVLIAATHKWTSTEELSRLYVDNSQIYPLIFKILPKLSEAFIFQTCHRVEYYLYFNDRPDIDNIVSIFFEKVYPDRYAQFFRISTGKDVLRHILRVSAGLESAIIGESDVLGQLEKAYDYALKNKYVRDMLKLIIERSIRFGKYVRTVTGISRGVHGYGSLSIKVIERLYGKLDNIKILVVGAGDLGSTIIKELSEKGVKSIIVLNRTVEKASQICRELGCIYDELNNENLIKYLNNVDVAILAVSSNKPIVTRELVKMIDRKPLIIDLGVPRLVEKDVEAPVIYFEDLTKLAEKYNREKAQEIAKVERLLEEELENTLRELEKKELKKVIGRYIEFSHNVARVEIEKAIKRGLVDAKDRENIYTILRSTISKLVRPIIRTIEETYNDPSMKSLIRKILDSIEKEFNIEKYDEKGSLRANEEGPKR